MNTFYHNDYIPEGYKVNQYLTSPDAWFIITDAPDGLKHFQRTGVETDSYVDFPTDNAIFKFLSRNWNIHLCSMAALLSLDEPRVSCCWQVGTIPCNSSYPFWKLDNTSRLQILQNQKEKWHQAETKYLIKFRPL